MTDLGRDDFGAFAGVEHMFFGLRDPFAMIREETENMLRKQVPDTVLESIVTFGKPKFLTLGAETGGGARVRVTHFGFCVRGRLSVRARSIGSATIDAAMTFLFGNVDRRGSETFQTHFDLNDDAERCFDDEVFQQRFLAFRVGNVE